MFKRRRRCGHCRALGARHNWTFHACADGRKRRARWLCDACDVLANAFLLTFFHVPDAAAKLEAYRP